MDNSEPQTTTTDTLKMAVSRTGIFTGETAVTYIPENLTGTTWLLAVDIVLLPRHVISQVIRINQTDAIISRREYGLAIFVPEYIPLLIDTIIVSAALAGFSAYDDIWTGLGYRIVLEPIYGDVEPEIITNIIRSRLPERSQL